MKGLWFWKVANIRTGNEGTCEDTSGKREKKEVRQRQK